MKSIETFTVDKKIDYIERLLKNPRTSEGWLAVDARLFRIHLEFQRWINEETQLQDDRTRQAELRDRRSVSIMRLVKDTYERGGLFPAALSTLDDVLRVLGLEKYAASMRAASPNPSSDERSLSFKFVKILRSKTKAPAHKYMRIQEDPVTWQLRLFGEFMDRSMDSQSDPRVSFKPDAWQRRVLDCLDDNHSVLVVGKCLVCFT